MRGISVAVLIMTWALVATGCKDDGSAASDGGVTTDRGTTDGPVSPDGPEICVDLPESFDADYTVKKGCYYAKKTPRIADAVRLTFEPGVKIIFSEDVGLNIDADQVLVAKGTADEPILLTGAQQTRGFWKGVLFSGTQSDDNRMEYVTVEYGGNTRFDTDTAGIKLNSDSRGAHASIVHCTVRESMGWGFFINASAVVPEFNNNTFAENALGPACVDSEVVPVLDSASSFKDNDRAQVVVRAKYISKPGTWHLLDVPYYIETAGGLTVSAHWTIAPGATLIVAEGVWLSISSDEGALIAKGTADKPIIFTGEQQQRGWWDGIVFDGSNNPHNAMDHVTVEYAGSTKSDQDGACVRLTGDSHGVQVAMTNTTIQQSQGWALFATGSAILPDFSGNQLTKSTLGPASIGSQAAHQFIAASSYTGNDVDRVRVRDNDIDQPVTWQDIGVPWVISGIQTSNVWTLAPGVVLMLQKGGYIEVNGPGNDYDAAALHAAGTAVKPIIITSSQPTKAPGDWESIVFGSTNNGANVLDHCTVEYGGGGTAKGWDGMIIATSDSHGVTVAVTNSAIQHSAVAGISKGMYAKVTLSDNSFTDNAGGDVVDQ